MWGPLVWGEEMRGDKKENSVLSYKRGKSQKDYWKQRDIQIGPPKKCFLENKNWVFCFSGNKNVGALNTLGRSPEHPQI